MYVFKSVCPQLLHGNEQALGGSTISSFITSVWTTFDLLLQSPLLWIYVFTKRRKCVDKWNKMKTIRKSDWKLCACARRNSTIQQVNENCVVWNLCIGVLFMLSLWKDDRKMFPRIFLDRHDSGSRKFIESN